MKVDVLKSIKRIEEEYRTRIDEALSEKERLLSSAKLEADNLIIRAHADIEEYRKKRLADARDDAAKKRAAILKEGEERAAAMRARGRKNLESAVALLLTRFKEQLHVTV